MRARVRSDARHCQITRTRLPARSARRVYSGTMRVSGLFLLLTVISLGCASAPPAPVTNTDSDEFQVETTVLAMYNVVSGPAGRHDWDRFKALFAPDARLIEIHMKDGVRTATVRTPDEFATATQVELAEQPLFEHPVATRVEAYGDLAQVLSTYESRRAAADATPFRRGVKSIQLVREGERWVIQTVLSEELPAESPAPR